MWDDKESSKPIEVCMNYSVGLNIKEVVGKGRGVFATQRLEIGRIVEIAPTVVLSPEDTLQVLKTKLKTYVYVDVDDRAVIALGYASLYNHSNTPNCAFVLDDSTIVMVARKVIEVGEELTIDYEWDNQMLTAENIK